MNLKRLVAASTLTAGVGAAGLLGLGVGTAAADPGHPCNGPEYSCQQPGGPQNNRPQGPQNNNDPDHWGGPDHRNGPDHPGGPQGPVDWQHRGIDRGRQDHQPFNWNGQQVNPMPAGDGHGWGFWFLGMWIPL
jgi:hypothetical protein